MFEAQWSNERKAFEKHGAPQRMRKLQGLAASQLRLAGCCGWWLRWVVFQGCTEQGCSFAGRLRCRKELLFREEPCETLLDAAKTPVETDVCSNVVVEH